MVGVSLEKWGEVSRVSAGGTKAKQYPQHRSAMALEAGELGMRVESCGHPVVQREYGSGGGGVERDGRIEGVSVGLR